MTETIERIGVAQNRELRFPVLFHRLRVKLSRKYRVFTFPDETGVLLDPTEFADRYLVVEQFKPEAN